MATIPVLETKKPDPIFLSLFDSTIARMARCTRFEEPISKLLFWSLRLVDGSEEASCETL